MVSTPSADATDTPSNPAAPAQAAASMQFGQYPPPLRTLLHLSDTHLLAGNPPLGGRYDTAANLARTLEAVETMEVRPDAIVFTGDLTDLGEPEAYRALRAAVEPVAERLDVDRGKIVVTP